MKNNLASRLAIFTSSFFCILSLIAQIPTDSDGDGLSDADERTLGYNPSVYTYFYYVDASRPDDSGDGLTLATAKQTIQAGINVVPNDYEEHVVLVAAATYTGNGNRDVTFYGKNLKLRSVAGPEITIIDGENVYGHRAFFLDGGEDASSWIDGFTVRNFYHHDSSGAAFYLHNSSPTIKNCVFESNYAKYGGTVLYVYQSDPELENCVLLSNSSGRDAAAIYIQDNSTTKVTRCKFIGNSAASGYGGAVYLNGGRGTFTDCRFEGNVNHDPNESGGAINATDTHVLLERCSFINNKSNQYGGAVYFVGNNKTLVAENCLMSGNYSRRGAGVIFNASGSASVNFMNCTILDSGGSDEYGGMANYGIMNITNSIVLDLIDDRTGTANVNYSLVKPENTGLGSHNFSGDPRLTPSGYLKSGSPCIDIGTTAVAPLADIHGETRPEGSEVDIGWDEFVDSGSDRLPDWST